MVEFVDEVMNIFTTKSCAGQLPEWLKFYDAAFDVTNYDVCDEYGHLTHPYKVKVARRIQTQLASLLSCV